MAEGLHRGLDVLELLAERGEIGLGELAKTLGASRATAFRTVTALRERGYVDHVPGARVYRLGGRLVEIASMSDGVSLVRYAAPVMSELRDATGETVNLVSLRRDRIVYELILEARYALRMAANVGDVAPPHATAVGKAILAWLPLDQRDMLLGPEPYQAYSEQTLTTRELLDVELRRTVARGYSVDAEETELGSTCIAAPVLGSDGTPMGALSVAGPSARITPMEMRSLGPKVRSHCDELSALFSPRARKAAAR